VNALLDQVSHNPERHMTSNSAEFSTLKNAQIYDVTQPFTFDNSCLAT